MVSTLPSFSARISWITGAVAFSERDGGIQPGHGTERWERNLDFKFLTANYTISALDGTALRMWVSLIFTSRLRNEAPGIFTGNE